MWEMGLSKTGNMGMVGNVIVTEYFRVYFDWSMLGITEHTWVCL